MQPANNFIVLNIREYLANADKRLGEETLVQLLSEFAYSLNPDVERFDTRQTVSNEARATWLVQLLRRL